MTPEERFTKIENLLHTVTQLQSRHDDAIARHDAQIAKQNAGIRDLVAVSRTLVDTMIRVSEAQLRTDAQIQELRTAQKDTDEKLNALIGTVERFIQGRDRSENP